MFHSSSTISVFCSGANTANTDNAWTRSLVNVIPSVNAAIFGGEIGSSMAAVAIAISRGCAFFGFAFLDSLLGASTGHSVAK